MIVRLGRRCLRPFFLCITFVLIIAAAGCGGGGQSLSGSSRAGSLARFDVDVKTGKVTVTPVNDPLNPTRAARDGKKGRAVFTGGAISFTTSDLYTQGGDSGQRLLQIDITNSSGQSLNGPARLVISNLLNAGAVDLTTVTMVKTIAGTGAYGHADGPPGMGTFGTPASIAPKDPNGNAYYICDAGNGLIRVMQADGTLTTLAGGTGGFGDGTGAAASFNLPQQIAADTSGNVFVADWENARIRRVTPLGEVTTIAGSGPFTDSDGPGNTATFSKPAGIAVSPDGNHIYVSTTNGSQIRMVTYSGGPRNKAASYTVSTLASGGYGFVNGPGGSARFSNPCDLALSTDGAALFVADNGNNAIRRIDNLSPGSAVVSTIVGNGTVGTVDGVGSVARLYAPQGIAVVGSRPNTLLVSDQHTVRLVTCVPGGEPSQAGSYMVSRIAGAATSGSADGIGTSARFNTPCSIYSLPSSGTGATMFCVDSGNGSVRKITLNSPLNSGGPANPTTEPVRILNADNEIPNQTSWAKNLATVGGGTTATLQFYIPQGVSGFSFTAYLEADGSIVNLPAVGGSYLTTVAGNGTAGTFNGIGKLAQFMAPYGVAAVPPPMQYNWYTFGQVRMFVADADSQRIRLITAAGEVKNFAGTGTYGFADGPAGSAMFRRPRAVTVTPDGSLFVADSENRAVRRIAPNGQVTTIAGSSATAGAADGPGNTATLTSPDGISSDSSGLIYFTEGTLNVVRRLEYVAGDPSLASSYYVRTVAGLAGSAGATEGVGSLARFRNPTGPCCDTDGRVYVADALNHTIRVLSRSGNVCSTSTLAGSAGASGASDGVGAAARLNTPTGVAADPAHNVYVVEYGGSRVRRISPLGDTHILMGGTGTGFTDGTTGTMSSPWGISIEANGNVLIADYGNKSIRCLQRLLTDGHSANY